MSADWAGQARARRTGRWILAAAAGLGAFVLLLCVGVVPMLLNAADDSDGGLADSFGCGNFEADLAGLPSIREVSKPKLANAAVIIGVGKQLKLPPRAWLIALATAAQESNLQVYANDNRAYPEVVRLSMALPHQAVGHDHDSVGLFQQRPVEGDGGWGHVAELMNPASSATKFYQALVKVPGWQRMRLTEASQRVQRSAFPGAYQKWEGLATMLVHTLAGDALRALGAGGAQCVAAGQISTEGWTVPASGPITSPFGPRGGAMHQGTDIGAPRGSWVSAAAGGLVLTAQCDPSTRFCDHDGGMGVPGCGYYVKILHQTGLETMYCHLLQPPVVARGDRVQAGQHLGVVGSSGNSSGPHLHFAVRLRGQLIDPVPFMVARNAPLGGRRV
jgi:murein DD-endopeptidase MepM/ murein hydrolase activator NlpD